MVPEEMGQAWVGARRVSARKRRGNRIALAEWWKHTGRDRLLLQLALAATLAVAAGAMRWLPPDWVQGRRPALDWALSARYTPLDVWRDSRTVLEAQRPRMAPAAERLRDWLRVLGAHAPASGDSAASSADRTATQPAAPASLAPEPSHPPAVVKPAAILSPFGWRPNAAGTSQELHEGLDLRQEKGTPVTAFRAGRVASVDADPRLGTVLRVDSPGDLTVRYAPLADVRVQPGTQVVAGQELGSLAGPPAAEPGAAHLHVETLVRGQAVNPMPILAQDDPQP